jgi:hypothetical protein
MLPMLRFRKSFITTRKKVGPCDVKTQDERVAPERFRFRHEKNSLLITEFALILQ